MTMTRKEALVVAEHTNIIAFRLRHKSQEHFERTTDGMTDVSSAPKKTEHGVLANQVELPSRRWLEIALSKADLE